MKLTPCKLKEMIQEEAQKMLSEDENPYTGWENLPPGWDEDSLESFAQSLTGQEGEEGFFTACMDKMEDEMDDAERFCASLKDQYLGREDWREGPNGEDETNEQRLTRDRLSRVIREEAKDLLSEQDFIGEYKLREVWVDGITGKLTLSMKLFMAPENPSGEAARNRIRDKFSDLRLDVNQVEFTGGKTMVVRLNEETIHAQILQRLMDKGIKL